MSSVKNMILFGRYSRPEDPQQKARISPSTKQSSSGCHIACSSKFSSGPLRCAYPSHGMSYHW